MSASQIVAMRTLLFFFVMALATAAAACGSQPPAPAEAQSESAHRYDATGEVRAIPADHSSVTIHHQAVPDYMPEMTMPFTVEDAHLLDGINVGDHVRFIFSAEPGGHHVLRSISKI